MRGRRSSYPVPSDAVAGNLSVRGSFSGQSDRAAHASKHGDNRLNRDGTMILSIGGPLRTLHHDDDHNRLRPLLNRQAGPRRAKGRARKARRSPDRIYTDHGLTGTNRERPGLDQALAAARIRRHARGAETRPAGALCPRCASYRGRPDRARVKLALGASVYDPADPMGKMFFNILATFAEFEADLIRLRTREGMAIARAKGKLRGKSPKLSDKQQKELRRMHDTGDYSISDLAEVFSVSRPTVYRTLGRQSPAG